MASAKSRAKKIDNVENVEDDDDTCSAHEVEENCDEEEVEHPVVECFSEQFDQPVDVLNADAEVEDLGKRKGTNEARESVVKKLRETPPNPNTTHGGYREVPVQGMTGKASGTYKTYKVKKDPYIREAKETMSKPVAVPLD